MCAPCNKQKQHRVRRRQAAGAGAWCTQTQHTCLLELGRLGLQGAELRVGGLRLEHLQRVLQQLVLLVQAAKVLAALLQRTQLHPHRRQRFCLRLQAAPHTLQVGNRGEQRELDVAGAARERARRVERVALVRDGALPDVLVERHLLGVVAALW